MATKWADYLISAVQYTSTGSNIAKVRVHPDNGDTVGSGVETLRSHVVRRLESGRTYATITRDDADGTWRRGSDVGVVSVDGEKYIRTDRNKIKNDNLGRLPRF